MQRLIDGQEAKSPILAAGHVGAPMARACGLSIYFPLFDNPSVHYDDLDFAQRTAWGQFLAALLGNGRTRAT